MNIGVSTVNDNPCRGCPDICFVLRVNGAAVCETRQDVKYVLSLQSDPHCLPDRPSYTPENKARTLIEEFGRRVHGNRKIVVQTCSRSFLPRLGNRGRYCL